MGKKLWIFYVGGAFGALMLFLGIVGLLVNPRVAHERGVDAGYFLLALYLVMFSAYKVFSERADRETEHFEEDMKRKLEIAEWKDKHPDLGFLHDTLLSELRQEQQRFGTIALWQSIALSVFMFILGVYITSFIASLAK